MPNRTLASVKNANFEKPPMSDAARERLADAYREDIRRLEELLNRPFSDWLET